MKRVRLMAASTAVVALTALSSAGTAHALTPFELQNADGGLCLDASTDPGSPHAPGDKVQLWTCDGSANQKWLVGPNGELVNQDGGLCLDASTDPGDPYSNGDAVQLWTCNGGSNQRWYWTSSSSLAYNVILNEVWSLALDASTNPGSPHVPGDAVQLWSDDGGPNQQWAQIIP